MFIKRWKDKKIKDKKIKHEKIFQPEVVAVVRPLLQPLVHLKDLVVRLQKINLIIFRKDFHFQRWGMATPPEEGASADGPWSVVAARALVRGGPSAREEARNQGRGGQIRGDPQEGRDPEIGVEVRGAQEVHNEVEVRKDRLALQGQREREVRRIRGGRGVTGPGSD